MKKKTLMLIGVMFVLVILVSGCTKQSGDTGTGTGDTGDGGSQGGGTGLQTDQQYGDDFGNAMEDFSSILNGVDDTQEDLGDFSTEDGTTPGTE